MIVALAGVTGIGKSYLKDRIADKLGFKRLTTITTRKRRMNENNIIDRIYVDKQELINLKNTGDIIYDFSYLGNQYAYLRNEVLSGINSVVEIHYDTVYSWREICPDICCIYLMPYDIEISKNMLRDRHLELDVEELRINEIDEHYNKFINDNDLQNQYDYILYNNYDVSFENDIIELVKSISIKNGG